MKQNASTRTSTTPATNTIIHNTASRDTASRDTAAHNSVCQQERVPVLHHRQLINYGQKLDGKCHKFSYFLDLANAPRMHYNPKFFDEEKKYFGCKNGQRKLLVSEIFFFTKFPTGHCVYVGAADGKHINFLVKLFPKITFDLYDPREFMIKESKRVKIFQQFFTDKDAEKYTGREDVLFISDIRTMEGYTTNEEKAKHQGLVEDDMGLQKRWVEIIRPRAYFLKFKLNWNKEKQVYLGGKLYLQSWNNPGSIELRLIGTTKDIKNIEYDNKKYEEQMCYYNVNERFQYFHMPKAQQHDGYYCGCHDCAAESWILQTYIERINHKLTAAQIQKKIMGYLIVKRDIYDCNKTDATKKETQELIRYQHMTNAHEIQNGKL